MLHNNVHRCFNTDFNFLQTQPQSTKIYFRPQKFSSSIKCCTVAENHMRVLRPSHPTHQVRYCRHGFSHICFVSSDHVRFLDTYFDKPLNFSVPQMSRRPVKKRRISRSKITSQFHVQCFLISLQSFKWSGIFQTFMEPPPKVCYLVYGTLVISVVTT